MLKKRYLIKVVNDVLLFLIFFLIVFISSGTFIAFFNRNENDVDSFQEINSPYTLRNGKAIYSELKQIRATSADSLSATIVLNPFLEYDSDNIPLQEEIVKKKSSIKNAIIEWFSGHTWLQIESKSEGEIKIALLNKINNMLQMGKISAIYLEEFRVIH